MQSHQTFSVQSIGVTAMLLQSIYCIMAVYEKKKRKKMSNESFFSNKHNLKNKNQDPMPNSIGHYWKAPNIRKQTKFSQKIRSFRI